MKYIQKKSSYSPTITGLKGRCTKTLEYGRCCCNTYHTPTILLSSLLLRSLLRNNFAAIEISRQSKDSHQIPHLLPLRIKIATIKGKYIFLGRENFLAGLLVKKPLLSTFCKPQREIRSTLRNIFTSF